MNTSHEDHLDARNEQARMVRALVRHEAEVRRLLDARWQRRIGPLLSGASVVSDDFEGCTE